MTNDTNGLIKDVSQEEARALGAMLETAITEQDALASLTPPLVQEVDEDGN